MKPHEIVDEGIWDTVKRGFAKKGWMGKTAQSAAYLSQAEEEAAALKQAQDKQRLANWLKILPVQIIKAQRAGTLTIPESAYTSYNSFSNIIENKIRYKNILSEADNLSAFMRQYIGKIAKQRGVQITPEIETAITTNINDFVRNVGSPPADVDPERWPLPRAAADSATKLWNIISVSSDTQQSQSTVGQTYPNPAAPVDVQDNKGNTYKWDGTNWKFNGSVISGASDIQELNQLAYEKSKNAPPAPVAEPTADVPDDKASGGLWTPEGAKNSYTFDVRTKVWMMHRPAPAGSPAGSSPLPSKVTDPRMIEKLNKLWAEQGESLE